MAAGGDSSVQQAAVPVNSAERLIRRFVPSTARLTFNPLFKALVDGFDVLPRLLYPELRGIPPNHLRIRIGAGNRLFANQISYLTWATNFWTHFIQAGFCGLASTIVEIGCGCGRYAQLLRDYQYKGERFSGRYVGIDVDVEMLEWCRRHFDSERFQFHQSTHKNAAYNARGDGTADYVLPVADESVDFVFAGSLFTHLLEREVVNYAREIFRVLNPGRHMAMYFFSLDRPPPTFGGRHTFPFEIGNAHVESMKVPEAAVAYKESFLLSVARDQGFTSVEVQAAPGDFQPILLCRK
jgi:SAM-dependent methyltransferase